MILDDTREFPPRFRQRSSSFTRNGTYDCVSINGDPLWGVVNDVTFNNHEWIYDVPQGKGSWNDVQHGKVTYIAPAYDSTFQCLPSCLIDPHATTVYTVHDYYDRVVQPILSVEEILHHPFVQHKLSQCIRNWHDGLYSLNAKNLPDVSIILMEDLPAWKGSIQTIVGLAMRLAAYGRKLTDLKFEAEMWRRKNKLTKALRAQREIRRISKLYLGTEFAVKQNVRTAIDLAAGILGGWTMMQFRKQKTAFRAHGIISVGDGENILCPWWAEQGRELRTQEVIRFTWTINTESKLSLKGSDLEQTLAKCMAKVGVLPQLASIWEATPYSWLVDYVFRAGLLLRYVERANEIGMTDLDIFRSSLSFRFEQETTEPGTRHGQGTMETRTFEFYERLVSPDLNFPPVLDWFKLPHGDQWAKALAFFFTQFK